MALLVAPVFAHVQKSFNRVGLDQIEFNDRASVIFDSRSCDLAPNPAKACSCKPQRDLQLFVGDSNGRTNACLQDAGSCLWNRQQACFNQAVCADVAPLDALSDEGCLYGVDSNCRRYDLAAASGYTCLSQPDLNACVGDRFGGANACFHDAGFCLWNREQACFSPVVCANVARLGSLRRLAALPAQAFICKPRLNLNACVSDCFHHAGFCLWKSRKLNRLIRVSALRPPVVAPGLPEIDIAGAISRSWYCDLAANRQHSAYVFKTLIDFDAGVGGRHGDPNACVYGAAFCCGGVQGRYPPQGVTGPPDFPEAGNVPELSTGTILLIGFAGLGLRRAIDKRAGARSLNIRPPNALQFFVFTRFLHANRNPLRSKTQIEPNGPRIKGRYRP